jgi:hypothetical protein
VLRVLEEFQVLRVLETSQVSKESMKGPSASELTMREESEGTSIVGCFYLHQGHL